MASHPSMSWPDEPLAWPDLGWTLYLRSSCPYKRRGKSMTFDILLLVCRLGQSPMECQPPTAFDKAVLGNVPNELRCMMDGQQHLAQASELIPEGYYAKFDLRET